MRVLMLTSRMDEDDWQYGFTLDWVKVIASRVTFLDVICQVAGPIDTPSNVTVTAIRGEQRISQIGTLLGFQRAVFKQIRNADVVFAHLGPEYALMGMPGSILTGVPLVHWYTFGVVSLRLLLTHPFVRRVVTASQDSYPLRGARKVQPIGHGIDFKRFVPGEERSSNERVVLAVGRLAPIKDWGTLIDAAAILLQKPGFEDVVFKVAGDVTSLVDYRDVLDEHIKRNELGERFELVGRIPYTEMPKFYQSGSILVSTSITGGIDKVVLEAMGCGIPAVVTDPIYESLLGDKRSALLAREGDPQDLAEKLEGFLSQSPEEIRAIGSEQREHAIRDHGIEALGDRLVAVFEDVLER